MKRRADFRRPENFWKEKGDMVLAVARYMGLPFCEMNGDMPKGISFCQVRYRTRKGEEKIKWLTDKPLKKKEEMLALCLWTIFPVGIYPTKRSLDPKEQRYGYLVGISDREGCPLCSAMIEVKWDGAIVKQTVDVGKERTRDMREEIPTGLRYPKAIFAKLNRCMARFFWSDLWCGPIYSAWYRPDNGIAVYMGNIGDHRETWGNGLTTLLQSLYGDAAAVLLSFTCFSLLRPWFAEYPMLDEKSSYLAVKKKLPQLLALNVCSRGDIHSAEQLAMLCCGVFQRMEEKKFPIYDGVAIQKFPKRPWALNEDEFERKILRPASVMWVNRCPAKGLKKENRILDLQVRVGAQSQNFEFDVAGLVKALTKKISDEDFEQWRRAVEQDRKRQTPIAIKALKELQKLEKKWEFAFQDVDIEDECQKLRRIDYAEDPIGQIKDLRQGINREITVESGKDIKALESETKKVLSDCLREMRKIHKENARKENFLTPYYNEARQEVLEIRGVKTAVLDKITFLWASGKFFITLLPEMDRTWVREKIFHALVLLAKEQKEPWSASIPLEKYLAKEIRDGNCARIRGERSDSEGITVWYDPQKQVFLLPVKTYFNGLCSYIEESQITRRLYEQKLAEEGALLTANRENQKRRTFEVKVQRGASSILVLKIPLSQFWEDFRADREIKRVLQKLHQEHTPLREH